MNWDFFIIVVVVVVAIAVITLFSFNLFHSLCSTAYSLSRWWRRIHIVGSFTAAVHIQQAYKFSLKRKKERKICLVYEVMWSKCELSGSHTFEILVCNVISITNENGLAPTEKRNTRNPIGSKSVNDKDSKWRFNDSKNEKQSNKEKRHVDSITK